MHEAFYVFSTGLIIGSILFIAYTYGYYRGREYQIKVDLESLKILNTEVVNLERKLWIYNNREFGNGLPAAPKLDIFH